MIIETNFPWKVDVNWYVKLYSGTTGCWDMDRQVRRTCSGPYWQVREPNCLVPDVGRAKCSGLPLPLHLANLTPCFYSSKIFTSFVTFHVKMQGLHWTLRHGNQDWHIGENLTISDARFQKFWILVPSTDNLIVWFQNFAFPWFQLNSHRRKTWNWPSME